MQSAFAARKSPVVPNPRNVRLSEAECNADRLAFPVSSLPCIYPLNLLLLFPNRFRVVLPVRIEEFFSALLPCSFHLRRGDIPIRPAFFDHRPQILTQIFHGRPTEEPIAHVNFVNDEAWFEHNRVRNHRVVLRIGVLGYIEFPLNDAARIRQKWPMRTDPSPEFISISDIVCADCHQAAVTDFHFTMQLKQSFMLSAIFRAISAAAENHDHWVLRLQFRQLAMFPGVIRKLVIWEDSSWNNVRTHYQGE